MATVTFASALLASSGHGQGTAEDYKRAERLSAAARALPAVGTVKANWLGSGSRFWYRTVGPDGRSQWVLVDPVKPAVERFATEADFRKVSGVAPAERELPVYSEIPESSAGEVSTRIVFQNDTRVAATLSWAPGKDDRRLYATLPPGGRRVQNTYSGHVWVAHGPDGKLLGAWRAADPPGLARIGARPSRPARLGGREASGLSPDGKWRATVENHNLVLQEVSGAGRRVATTDGTAVDRYAVSDVFWAPDSRRLVAFRTEPAQSRTVHIVESSPADQLQPKLKSLEYLKPGDRIAHPRPVLVDLETGKSTPISDNLFANPWSLTRLGSDPWADGVTWAPDSSAFWFVYNERGHQKLRIVRVEAKSAQPMLVHEESSPTFIDYANKFHAQYLPEYGAILWMSERDGWNHLVLLDAVTGGLRNRVTSGEWLVRDVDRVDSEGRVWFRAMGIRPGQDPYHVHFARVGLDGQGLVVLTEADGTHRVEFSPDRAFLIDTWSRVDSAPVVELRQASDGKLVQVLERGDQGGLAKLGLRLPQRFVAKGRDGRTDIWGVVFRPSNHDPARRYPVVEQIYAGPQGHFVPKEWSAWHGQAQALTELGFVVVQIDGMGTNWRSKAFHDVCWRNLKDAGFPDRIAWIKALAVTDRSIDLSRVGIYGGSAGGQNALAALIWHGDFYKAAVADCGCHDNRMDKIWWNELWMGWPVGEHYAANSNRVHAGKVTGKLMLVVGELDTNVDPATTMQVASTLVKADRDFDLLVIPGAGHGAAETPYGRRRRQDFFVRHLWGTEPRREAGAGVPTAPQRMSNPGKAPALPARKGR